MKKLIFLIIVGISCSYIHAQTAEEYTKSGQSKLILSDYTGAIKDCNKAIEINPNNADAYVNRGAAKVNIRDNKGTIDDCNKAIELKI